MVCAERERALRVQRVNGAPAAITASWKGGRELERTVLATCVGVDLVVGSSIRHGEDSAATLVLRSGAVRRQEGNSGYEEGQCKRELKALYHDSTPMIEIRPGVHGTRAQKAW